MLIFTAKNFAIFFGLATIAFCTSTIVLAVQKSDLQDELDDALSKLDALTTFPTAQTVPPTTPSSTVTSSTVTSSTVTSSSTGTSSSTMAPPTDPTTEGGSTSSSTESSSSSSTSTTVESPWPTITVPEEHPNLPTLPPGLPNPESIQYRLPNDLMPIKYRLHIEPDLETGLCHGTVSIQIEVINATNLIVMHASEMEIESISILHMMTRMRIRVKDFYLRKDNQLLIIELYELLTSSPYTVSISYVSRLAGTSGLYRSSYLDEDLHRRWIATSKFEPTFARQAFPCFDEPAMKAQFAVTIVRPTDGGYHALSNMDVEDEVANGNVTEVIFTESVPMSTYLVCFLVSDFAHKSKPVRGILEGANDFEMRVFSTPAQVDKVQYALDTGVAITEYYTEYFNVNYPLPKLDMAAIPDFVSGAMENWGIVTFRETALLYDPTISSSANKQRVATVVAHELAHMWFGNLVTMKWWNDLWLNEGFANFIEYEGVNKVHPEWDMPNQFLIEDLHSVMALDATLASHPIVQTVESPEQITELFDSITYSKGASVIRMLKHLVGDEKFRNATTNYLNNFIYNNAETDDFFTELEALGFDYDIKLIMQTWTVQMGLPVVQVEKLSDTQYKLTQKRFFSNPEDYNGTYTDSQFNYRWSIPIAYFTSGSSEVKNLIFNHGDNEVSVSVPNAVDWIKFNKDQVGYYHVNYPVEMWESLITALKTNRGLFSTGDRAHLIADAFALADASQLPYGVAMNLTTYLENELDYVPWSVALQRLAQIKSLLYYTNFYHDIVLYSRRVLNKAYESVTWNVGADHLQNLLRVKILQGACSFGHDAAIEEAGTRFKTWLQNPSERPNPDIRGIVYYYGMQSVGNEKYWNQVWDLFLAEQDAQEKIKLMEALTAIKEPWILHRMINLAWNETNVRGQDYFTCLQYISKNSIGKSIVWDYVRENWQRFVDRFGLGERYLGRLIPQITANFATQTKLEEMEAFFAKYPDAGAGTSARKQALERVKNNINWLKTNQLQVGDWLATQNTKASIGEFRTAAVSLMKSIVS